MERWQHIESIFERALRLAPSERDRFLRQACAEDVQLLEEVASLIAHDSSADTGTWAADAAARLVGTPGPSTPATSSATLTGATIGRYTVGSSIGVGAMGQVYRARDGRLNRDVAIKVLPVDVSNTGSELRRVHREARALGSVNHPNIGAIYDVIESDGAAYLVLELVEGIDLAARLREGPLSVREAVAIAGQIADALDAAHGAGIVHRDLKPANIKLTPTGRIKVLDFGVSRTLDTNDEDRAGLPEPSPDYHVTLMAGTPAYMSPEQARGHPVDARSDIWAFGCVVYELLAGRRAFPATSPTRPDPSARDAEPDWSLLPADTPGALIDVLRGCLRHDAQRRLPDAQALRRAIDAIDTTSIGSMTPSGAGTGDAHAPNLLAYESFEEAARLQTRLSTNTPEDAGTRIEEHLKKAIALDGQWAAPHSALGRLYFLWSLYGSQDMATRSRAAALDALRIEPSDPLAHAVLGAVAGVYDHDWEAADKLFTLAAAAEPLPPYARHLYAGFHLAPLGRFDDALQQLGRAMAEDPLNMPCRGRYLLVLQFAEMYDRAIAEAQKQLEFDARHIAAHSMIALAALCQGKDAEAREWAENALRSAPTPLAVAVMVAILKRRGETDGAERLLRTWGGATFLGPMAIVHHVLCGEYDAALDSYERAIADRQAFPAEWAAAGLFRPLRASPRWQRLARMMNLPESTRAV